jgi:hypothetical protein
VILLAALALQAASPANDTIRVFGVATARCDVWTRHRSDPRARSLQLSFANGFLTALTIDRGPTAAISSGMNVEAALDRVDWYCRTFPEWTVAQAFAALLGEIRESARQR